MSNFLLVHGGFHRAWCWDLLIPELEALGHRAAAVDLPIEQVGAGPDRYAAVVAERLATLQRPVWLVGHAMGGIVIPRVRPLDGARGVCAILNVDAFCRRYLNG